MTDTINLIANDLDALSSRWASDRSYMGSPVDDVREIVERLRALSARAAAGEGGECPAWALMKGDEFVNVSRAHDGETPDSALPTFLRGAIRSVKEAKRQGYHVVPARVVIDTAAPQPAQAGASGGGVHERAKAFFSKLRELADHDPADESVGITSDCWHVSTADLLQCMTAFVTASPITPASPATGKVTGKMICEALGVPFGYAIRIVEVKCEEPNAHREHGRWLSHIPTAAEKITGALAGATPQPAAAQGGEWVDGVKACIAWVEKRRHDFECEHGMIDPTTGAMEFRSVAKEEYDAELGEIEEGLRSMLAAAPQPQEAPLQKMQRIIDRVVTGVMEQREEVLSAFVAKHGFQPDEAVQVVEADGSWRVIRRSDMYTPPAHGDGEGDARKLYEPDDYADAFKGRDPETCQRCGKTFLVIHQCIAPRPTPEAQEARDAVDARRYRYLRDHCKREWYSDMPHNKGAPSLDIEFEARGHDLDAAIDAALALPAQGEGKNG